MLRTNFHRHAVVLLLAPLLMAGCASTRDTLVQRGYPPGYAQGFDDGCHSGRKAGGSMFDQFEKDGWRFDRDRDYATGWSDGFRQCESQQENAMRQSRMVIEQQRLRELRQQNRLDHYHELEREALDGVDTSGLKSLK